MPSSLLSPFPELDADLPTDFASLFSGVSLKDDEEEQPSTYSSCPVNLNDSQSNEPSTDCPLWPLPNPWSREDELPLSTPLRLIPFQADRSVSMIEESNSSAIKPPSSALSSRYKTELCRTYHESGACKYGTKCQFAHGSGELRGLNRHPKYKTELCRTYHTIGFCPYGSRCHFIHNAEEQRFNSGSRGHRPPLLRHSVSCSGIPSSTSLSSLSHFSSSIASSLTSLSPFSPSSPMSPTSNPFASISPSSPSNPFASIGPPSPSNPFPSIGPPSPSNPFASIGPPSPSKPFASIGPPSPSKPFASVGPSSPTSPPVVLNLPIFGPVSPPRLNLENTLVGGLQLQLSPWRRGDPKGEERWDSLPHPDHEESAVAFGNSQEAKRLPIFSFLAD